MKKTKGLLIETPKGIVELEIEHIVVTTLR